MLPKKSKNDLVCFLLLLLSFSAVGLARYRDFDDDYRKNPLRGANHENYVDITGTVISSPRRETDRDVLDIKIDSLSAQRQSLAIHGRLRLNVPVSNEPPWRLQLFAGDRIQAAVKLSPGFAFRNFNTFSYELYLEARQIHRRAYTKSSRLLEKIQTGKSFNLKAFFSRWRVSMQDEIVRHFPSSDRPAEPSAIGAVIEALLLGADGRLAPQTADSLQKSGLYHLLAISGGHIAVVMFILYLILRLCALNQRKSMFILAVVLIFYAMIIEASPTIMRSILMAETAIIGKLIWKDVQLLNFISLSALVLLLINPYSIHDVGFQLTYAATLCIIVFAPGLERPLRWLPRGLAGLATMSLAATAGVLPIIARSFNRVTFASFFLNFGAVPLTGVIMTAGYIFLIISPFWADGATFLAMIITPLTSFWLKMADSLNFLSFLSYRLPTPKPWTIAGYYLTLSLFVIFYKHKVKRTVLMIFFIVFFLLIILAPFRPAVRNLTLTMIDVGQGEAILVEFPGHKKMLVDCGGGGGSSFDIGEKIVSPFLWGKGMRRLDYVVISHLHPDHSGGLKALAKNFQINEIWATQSTIQGLAGEEFIRNSRLMNRLKTVGASDKFYFGQVEIEVLSPERAQGDFSAAFSSVNENSLVLKIACREKSFLLTGDIGPETESRLLENRQSLQSSVLKVAHHGAFSKVSAEFIAAVKPEMALISVGSGNPYGFPAEKLMNIFKERGLPVFRTDLDGAIEMTTDGKTIRVRKAVNY